MSAPDRPIRITLFAPDGRMGKAIARVVADDPRFAIDQEKGDVLVDFSAPDALGDSLSRAVSAGIPILVGVYHANPAVMAAIGMFSAYCGTLMTPMAANFNIVPAALLELKDRNGVIKAQIGTALPLLGVNILLIYWLAFL